MEYKTTQKFIRVSPRKLREIVAVIKGLTPEMAVEILPHTGKRAAEILLKTISLALNNVPNEAKSLVYLKEIQVGEGPRQKRWKAGARGRAKPFRRKLSHLRIVLAVKEDKGQNLKEEKKTTKEKNVKKGANK